MNSEELKQIYEQYFYHIVIAGVIIGLIFGAIPLILGMRRGKRNLGFLGLILSGVAGAFSPLVSAMIAALFIFLVMRKPSIAPTSDAAIPNDPDA